MEVFLTLRLQLSEVFRSHSELLDILRQQFIGESDSETRKKRKMDGLERQGRKEEEMEAL